VVFVVDPAAPGKLSIKPVELRDPDRDEVAVRVTAISLNRGETRRAVQQAEPGWRPGWDFAGVAETAAADGSGPKPGTRVVGILPSGAWAERVNCRTHAVAALPDAVGDAEAATLPVAGLTALHALRQGGLLLGRKMLVDGASGGVGHLACQLAAAAGAQVWGHVRREEYRAAVAQWCGERVVLGRELVAAKPRGPFWLILDSLGGSALGAALGMLQPGGICVTFGVSEAAQAALCDAILDAPDLPADSAGGAYPTQAPAPTVAVQMLGALTERSPPGRSSSVSPATRRSLGSVSISLPCIR
jgi:NADPH:quinone reductase